MCKQEITFDKLPQAITYLTEQVAELKQLVSELQPPQSEKHLLVQKAKPTVYALVRKGLLPSYKKGKQLYFYEDELLTWIENGRKNTSEQNYDQMLASMQNGIRRKPKSGFNL